MTNTTTTTENNKETLTSEQIATKYLTHNLQTIQKIIELNTITNSKKNEIALIIDNITEIFKIHNRIIQNIDNNEEISRYFQLQRIYKLEIIKLITTF